MNNSRIFSTGQSWQDLIDLAKLAALLPTEPPPVLTDPEYVPNNRGAAMTIAYAGTAGLVVLFMVIRTLARSRLANFGTGDALVILALAMIIGVTILACVGAKMFQWGYSSHDLTIRSIVYTIRFNYAIHFMTAIGAAALRITFLMMLRDKYKRSYSRWKWYTNVSIGISVIIPAACIVGFIFQCSRVGAGYDLWERVRIHCNVPALHVPIAIAYLLNDMLVMVVGSKMAMRRWQAMVMEGLGLIPLAAAIARVYFWRPTVYLDWFDIMLGTISSQIEMISAFMILCLPSFNLILESDISFEAVLPNRFSRRVGQAENGKAIPNNPGSRALDHEVLEDDPIQDKAIMSMGSKGSQLHSPAISRGPLSGNVEYRENGPEFETVVFDGDVEREKKFKRTLATASAPATAPHSPITPSPLSRNTTQFETPSYEERSGEYPSSGWRDGDGNKGRLSTIHSVYEGRRNSDGSNYHGQHLGLDLNPGPGSLQPMNYTLNPASGAASDARSMAGSVSPMSGAVAPTSQGQSHNSSGANTIGASSMPRGGNASGSGVGYGCGHDGLFSYHTTGNMNRAGYPKISPIFSVPDADDDNDSNVSPTASASALARNTFAGPSVPLPNAPGGFTSDRKDSDVLSGVGTIHSAWRQNARLSTISSFYSRSRNNSSYSLPDEDTDQQLQYVNKRSIDERMRKVV